MNSYNNITGDGCNELFERRVLEAELCVSNHTGFSAEDSVIETEWNVTVSCWEECPDEPIFGTDIQRRLQEAITAMPSSDPTADEIEEPKSLISQLDFQVFFETEVHHAAEVAGWEKPKSRGNGGGVGYDAVWWIPWRGRRQPR